MSNPSRVVVSGPLSEFAPGFLEELVRRGYRPATAAKQLRLMAHLSRWMEAEELEPGGLRRVEIERFLQDRRASGRTRLASARALDRLLEYLRGLAVVPSAGSREASTLAGALLDRYSEYLPVRRGLAVETVRGYCNTARAFLADREGRAGGLELEGPGPGGDQRVPAAGVAARECLLGAGDRHRAAVAAALPAPRRADRSRSCRCGSVGGEVAAGVAG